MGKSICASIVYDGIKREISAGSHTFEKGLLVEYEVCEKEKDAYYAVLKLKNNSSENTGRIQLPKSLDLLIPSAKNVVYYGLKGDSCGAESFMPIEFILEDQYHEEPTGGRSSNTSGFPFFDLSFEKEALAIAIGWSGQWSKDICQEEDGVRIQIGLCHADFYLKPQEEIRLPSVLVIRAENGEESRRRMREVLRKDFSPAARLGEDMTLPVSIQCFDLYFWEKVKTGKCEKWASETGQKVTVDETVKIGNFDTLWLDAAWFAEGFPHGVGNYRFSEGFPSGLKPVADHAHKNGLNFLVWFEPERIYEGSDLFPKDEYLLSVKSIPEQKLYNLADDAACTWLEETLISMIRENGIDIYRQDFNMEPLPYWLENDEPGRCGMTEIRYVSGLYRLWDRLIAEFPQMLIDNCSSGGRRLDLETMSRAVSLWRSDTGCFPETEEKKTSVWSQNQILTLSEYLPYHSCAVWDSDAYTVRSTATQGLACTFDILNDAFDQERASKALKEVQELRKYWNQTFYPLTKPDEKADCWCAYQLAGETDGIVSVFRRDNCEESEKKIVFRQIDSEAEYQLEWLREDYSRSQSVITGSELVNGLLVELAEKRSSLVIKYAKIK